MDLKAHLRRLSPIQVETLARELAFEFFHRGIPRWQILLDVADELHHAAVTAARNQVTRRLAATLGVPR